MHNDLFSFSLFGRPITIHGYGLMIAIGILVAIVVAIVRAKKKKIDPDPLLDVALIVLFAGFLGGKLMYIIVEWKSFIDAPNKLAFFGGGGFVVYGGIILVLLACVVYFKIRKLDFYTYFDLVMPEVSMAQALGRVGCFLAGCCFGAETTSPIGVVFPPGIYGITPGVRVWPTQIFMAVGNLVIAGILLLAGRYLKKRGQIGALYLILYSVGRFAVEFFRADPRGTVFRIFSTSQFVSIFVFIAGVALFVWRTKKTTPDTFFVAAKAPVKKSNVNQKIPNQFPLMSLRPQLTHIQVSLT